ncbi:hypothetical protein [Caldicellulosiruptor acetigenus]|nr:hypothetical protein [Caldicellulosiruptor acetigenus]
MQHPFIENYDRTILENIGLYIDGCVDPFEKNDITFALFFR